MLTLFVTVFNVEYLWYMVGAILVGVITYNYFKWKRTFQYWSDRNIRGPKPVPYFGNNLSTFLKTRHGVDMDMHKTYGRIVGAYDRDKPVLSVTDPALIKQIVMKDNYTFHANPGEKIDGIGNINLKARADNWKRIRVLTSGQFSAGAMRHTYPLIDECCRDFMAALAGRVSAATGGTEVELKHVMDAYTMDAIATTGFAIKIDAYSHPNHNNPFTTKARLYFQNQFATDRWHDFVAMILPTRVTSTRAWKWLATGGGREPEIKFFVDFARRLIAERRTSGVRHNDVLQVLMDAERVQVLGDNNAGTTGAAAVAAPVVEKLTDAEIADKCAIIFIAAFHTTAATLAFCAHELAVNPGIQDQLVAEANGACDGNTGHIDYETLCRLPFLDAVLSETLRKYPPGIRLSREAAKDVMLSVSNGDSRGPHLMVEKGVEIAVPVYAIHHDPDYYSDPNAFKPDRFMANNRHNIKPYTYLPFGAGPHLCLGMAYALVEAKLALVNIVRQFRLYRVPDTDVPVVFTPGRRLLTSTRLRVGVAKR